MIFNSETSCYSHCISMIHRVHNYGDYEYQQWKHLKLMIPIEINDFPNPETTKLILLNVINEM